MSIDLLARRLSADATREDNLLIERGRTNTNKMVNGMLHAAGVRNVIINYDEPAA